MRFPSECYQIHQTLRQRMPHLTRGNLILLSESEYRSETLQVQARSLPLSRHADFQRIPPRGFSSPNLSLRSDATVLNRMRYNARAG